MPRKRTKFQKATGKLISAIQKEWGDELGESPTEPEMSELLELVSQRVKEAIEDTQQTRARLNETLSNLDVK